MRFLLRSVVGFVFICVLGLVGAAGWTGWRYYQSEAADKAADNPVHLAAKHQYLTTLARDYSPGGKGFNAETERPNIVVILFDDLGWQDIGPYGNTAINTPAINKMAEEGARFTHYFAPAPYCTPSRAGLLTGRLPVRTNLTQVTFPEGTPINTVMRVRGAGLRLPRHEITVAETLNAVGYRTGMIGKWHLGEGDGAEPNDFGFERYFGVLHSNDMAPLPLWRNKQIVDPHPIDQSVLTDRYTTEATSMINDFAESGKPFFLYFAHTFPHIPLYAPQEKLGQSKAGLYGDVVEELDRSVGRVFAALEAAGVADNTIVVLTSDNGPWYEGVAGPMRGRKNETFDGGQRVPFIVWWPGHVEGGHVSSGLSMGTDFVPTVLALLDLPAPEDRVIDGADARALWFAGGDSPHDMLFMNRGADIQAVRTPTHKLRDKAAIYGGNNLGGPISLAPEMGPMLYNLTTDPMEGYDASLAEPATRAELEAILRAKQKELQDNREGWKE